MLISAGYGAVRALVGAVIAVAAVGAWAPGAESALPDGRGYELVSPPDKNGGDVIADSQRTRAAADGGAVGFISFAAFSDVLGTSIVAEYIAERSGSANPGANGWATHSISPAQQAIPFRALVADYEAQYDGEFSDDLNSGMFISWGAFTHIPAVQEVGNVYVRTDLRSPGPGSYALATPCPLCDATRAPLPGLPELSSVASLRSPVPAGMSPDGGHVVFETIHSLTSDSAAVQSGVCDLLTLSANFCRVHVYEWDHGTLRLAGILPDGTPADVSVAGDGAGASHVQNRTPHVVSDGTDGHTRVFFTQPTNARGQTSSQVADGSFQQIQVNRAFSGNVFARIDGVATVQLNASERAAVDTFAPAQFLDASADGARSFFMTKEALTDDTSADGQTKLYMYDASKPADAPDNLTLLTADIGQGANAQGMIGASDDGHFVYMLVTGQLVRGGPTVGNNWGIFLWHDGAIAYVGYVPPGTAAAEIQSTRSNHVASPRQARVTPDGRHLLFSAISADGLAGYDHGTCASLLGTGCRELYVYGVDTGRLQCASCRPGGEAATAMASAVVRANHGGAGTTWHQTHALSDDGRYVFFSTPEALVPEDVNGKSDAYVFDTESSKVSLLSSGHSESDSWFMDASRDGRDVFFLTREPLVGWDVDTAYDLYDARVGGGFPEPTRAPPVCFGAACQGPRSSAPTVASPGTELFRGGGNLGKVARKPVRACRRGFVKKRVRGKRRCVKRHRARRVHGVQRRGA